MSAIVIVPTYNESANIATLTPRLLELGLGLDVLFVDDNSPDGTGKVADKLAQHHSHVSVIHRSNKLGYASAIIEGFHTAFKGDYSRIITMDADLSHDVSAIPQLLRAADEHDLVLGSRYIGGIRVIDWEMSRLLLSWLANRYARLVTGLPFQDLTSGFRCYSRSALESIDFGHITADGYGFQIEMAYRVWESGSRITEVPIIFYGRQQGASKLTKWIIIEAAALVWRLRLGRLG